MGQRAVPMDSETVGEIEELHEQSDDETKTETASRVARAGLREVAGPVDSQWRRRTFNAAYHLAVVAIAVVLLGFGSRVLSPAAASRAALALVTAAVSGICVVEGLRAVGGQGPLGRLFRRGDA